MTTFALFFALLQATVFAPAPQPADTVGGGPAMLTAARVANPDDTVGGGPANAAKETPGDTVGGGPAN